MFDENKKHQHTKQDELVDESEQDEGGNMEQNTVGTCGPGEECVYLAGTEQSIKEEM